MSNFDEEHIQSLLNALSLSEDLTDVNELKSQLQKTHNQVLILQQKHSKYKDEMQRFRKQIWELNKERIKTRKQIFELTFQRDLAEHNVKSIQNDLLKVQNELKLKTHMFTKIENDRRKAQILTQKNISYKKSLNKSNSVNQINFISEEKSVRNEKQAENERKLLSNGLVVAYNASKASKDNNIDKTLVLQRLLLTKVKELAEKDVILEEYKKQCNQMKQQINRLRQAKHIAEELTSTRHKLNVKTNQLDSLKTELRKYKEEKVQYIKENQLLKHKITEYHDEKRKS